LFWIIIAVTKDKPINVIILIKLPNKGLGAVVAVGGSSGSVGLVPLATSVPSSIPSPSVSGLFGSVIYPS